MVRVGVKIVETSKGHIGITKEHLSSKSSTEAEKAIAKAVQLGPDTGVQKAKAENEMDGNSGQSASGRQGKRLGSRLAHGWTHIGCGPWEVRGRIPSRWRRVRDGAAQAGDKALEVTPKGMKMKSKQRRSVNTLMLPWAWVDVAETNAGLPSRRFLCLIRRAKEVLHA